MPSMVLLGTIVNAAAIVMGSLIGTLLHNIPERMKTTVTQGMALAVVVLGLEMAFQSKQFLIVIASLAIGGVIGEWIDLDHVLNRLGRWLEKKIGVAEQQEAGVAKAFVTATLVFVIGAMAIIGAIHSGMNGDHRVLYTKSMLDGFFAVIFSTTLGIGVIFSAIPVFLYEGSIALAATAIIQKVPDPLLQSLIKELTADGGILIAAIGLNLLNIVKIRTANLLPSLVIVPIAAALLYVLK